MREKYYIGLDVSTQGTKLVLLDYEASRPVFVTAVNYDRDLPQYKTVNGVVQGLGEGVSESDPKMWIDAVRRVFSDLKAKGWDTSKVRAMSVSGQQHGLVCLDEAGALTRKRSKLWNDVSTAAECREITGAAGGQAAMLREISNVQKPGYTAGKILHFKKEDPEAFARTRTFFLVHNFIDWFLTGAKAGGVRVMEPGDTSGTALWNPATGKFSKTVCNIIAPDLIDRLPPVKPADEFIGTVSQDLCGEYGFPKDCRIDAGSGDNMYGAAGTGNVKEGIVTVSLGTSGTACTIFNSPYVDPQGEIASYCDAFGRYMPLLCVSNLANGYNQLIRQYGLTHEAFAGLAAKQPPGNGGLVLLPWYTGERTPNLPDGSPVYFGFGLGDFTPEKLCRAVVEGHVMNLYEGFMRMPVESDTVHLTGGLAQSPAWRQTIADIFNCSVVPVKGEGAALGAAVHAAYVDNKADAEDLHAFVRRFIELDIKHAAHPEPAHATAYAGFKETYLALSRRVRGEQSADDPFQKRRKWISL
jgi:xylulokinase